jgi:integrase/recombinase XerC
MLKGLIERWKEGRSPQTLRAYANDLQTVASWTKTRSVGAAVSALLSMDQGEANELVRSYRSALTDQGVAPATINRRLSSLRSLVALGKECGYVSFDLATKNVRAEAYRDTRGPEPDVMVLLLEYAKAQPHTAKAARDVAICLLLGYGRALRRGEVVALDLEHFDPRGNRLSVLRKGKRERKLLSLDPVVTTRLRAWVAFAARSQGRSSSRSGRAVACSPVAAFPAMAFTRSCRLWARNSVASSARMGSAMQRSRRHSTRPTAMSAPPASSRGIARSRC